MSKKTKEIDRIAEALKAKLALSDTGTQIIESEPCAAFNATLADGLTPEVVDSVQEHMAMFVTASLRVAGEMAAQAVNSRSGITEVSAQLGMGTNSHVSHRFVVKDEKITPITGVSLLGTRVDYEASLKAVRKAMEAAAKKGGGTE